MINEGGRKIAYLNDEDGEGHPVEIGDLQGTKWFYRGMPTWMPVFSDDDIAQSVHKGDTPRSRNLCWLNRGNVMGVIEVNEEQGLLKVNITDSLGTPIQYDVSSKNLKPASGVWVSDGAIRHPSTGEKDPRTSWQRDDREGGPHRKARAAQLIRGGATVRSTDVGGKYRQLLQAALRGIQPEA